MLLQEQRNDEKVIKFLDQRRCLVFVYVVMRTGARNWKISGMVGFIPETKALTRTLD